MVAPGDALSRVNKCLQLHLRVTPVSQPRFDRPINISVRLLRTEHNLLLMPEHLLITYEIAAIILENFRRISSFVYGISSTYPDFGNNRMTPSVDIIPINTVGGTHRAFHSSIAHTLAS